MRRPGGHFPRFPKRNAEDRPVALRPALSDGLPVSAAKERDKLLPALRPVSAANMVRSARREKNGTLTAVRRPFGGPAVSSPAKSQRPVALRPRLAAGLPVRGREEPTLFIMPPEAGGLTAKNTGKRLPSRSWGRGGVISAPEGMLRGNFQRRCLARIAVCDGPQDFLRGTVHRQRGVAAL